ncbi:hypothetical protein ACFL35_19130, partial [Candidatus Riflebacteria bacterium]
MKSISKRAARRIKVFILTSSNQPNFTETAHSQGYARLMLALKNESYEIRGLKSLNGLAKQPSSPAVLFLPGQKIDFSD